MLWAGYKPPNTTAQGSHGAVLGGLTIKHNWSLLLIVHYTWLFYINKLLSESDIIPCERKDPAFFIVSSVMHLLVTARVVPQVSFCIIFLSLFSTWMWPQIYHPCWWRRCRHWNRPRLGTARPYGYPCESTTLSLTFYTTLRPYSWELHI